ncbi:hypothetical protein L3Q82_023876, partial [Scortum barcoo]
MLQTGNYSLVLLIQLSLLAYDLFVNSFSELLRGAPVIQLVLFIIQDIAILFNVIIILLMMFNTYVFQVGLVSLLLERFRALLMFSALYLTLSICLHCWVLVCFNTPSDTCTSNLSHFDLHPSEILTRPVTLDGLSQTDLFGQTVFNLFSFSREQRQCCITTYTSARQSIWVTRSCMKTLCGCETPSPELVSEGLT